jgi:hypothetical protein
VTSVLHVAFIKGKVSLILIVLSLFESDDVTFRGLLRSHMHQDQGDWTQCYGVISINLLPAWLLPWASEATKINMKKRFMFHTRHTRRERGKLGSKVFKGRDILSWQRPNSDPYNITTKWLTVNLKLPGISHGQFWGWRMAIFDIWEVSLDGTPNF